MFLRLTLFKGNPLISPISATIVVCPPPSPIEIVCRPLEVWRSIEFPVPAYASTDAEESSGRFPAKVFCKRIITQVGNILSAFRKREAMEIITFRIPTGVRILVQNTLAGNLPGCYSARGMYSQNCSPFIPLMRS